MKLAQLLVVVATVVCGGSAGLLRVPRVYNALISTNQRLAPSRADTVSLPVLGPVALLPALVAEEPAPPPAAAAKNASDSSAGGGNHTAPAVATAALVAPLAVYSPYYYPAYPYHYNPFLLPPAPLLHYGYSYLPLALAHPAADPAGDGKPEARAGGDALPQGAKVDTEKDAVSVEAI